MSVSDSNSSSSVPKPPGRMTNAVRVLHEHRLAGEEVAELDAEVDVGVERLLVRQLDVAADREPAALLAAAVGRLHRARAAAGDDRVAGLGELATDARAPARSSGRPGCVRAEPKTVTAGPTVAIASKPSTNSERMRSARHGIGVEEGRLGPPLEEPLVLGRAAVAPRRSAASGVTRMRPARRVPGRVGSIGLGCHRGGRSCGLG